MAREVHITLLCDPCMVRDERTEGVETPPITIGSKKAARLVLCEPHKKEFYDPLAELLAEEGETLDLDKKTAKRAKRAVGPIDIGPGEFECPVEDCDKVYKWRGSLRNHVRDEHNAVLGELEAAEGEAPPKFPCTVKGCGRVFDTAQGIALHTTRIHKEK